MSTKNITLDLKINKSIVTFCSTFRNQILDTFNYIEENFVENLLEDYENNIGHNKSLKQIVQTIQLKIQNLSAFDLYLNHTEDSNLLKSTYSVWKRALDRDQNYENEESFFENVRSEMQTPILLLRQYIHYVSSMWVNSNHYDYLEDVDFSIQKKETFLNDKDYYRGIINFMTLRKKTYILNSLKLILILFQKQCNEFISVKNKVTNKNENLESLRLRFDGVLSLFNHVLRVLEIAIDELQLLFSDDLTPDLVLYPEMSTKFREYIFLVVSYLEELNIEFNSMLHLL